VGNLGQALPALNRDRLGSAFHRPRSTDHGCRPFHPRCAGGEAATDQHKHYPGRGAKTPMGVDTISHGPLPAPRRARISAIWYAPPDSCQVLDPTGFCGRPATSGTKRTRPRSSVANPSSWRRMRMRCCSR